MRRAARTDANHVEIVRALQQLGFAVAQMHGVGSGFPDLLVARRGEMALIEVKTSRGRPNARQQAFYESWPAPVYVIREVEDVIEFSNLQAQVEVAGMPDQCH